MHVLVLGYSGIVKKRVLPALKKIKQIDCIDIASCSQGAYFSSEAAYNGTFFNDYADALTKSKADIVYISLVNSMHAEWAERALLKGCHVIVDKPSFTSLDDAVRLANLARQKSLCLFPFHPFPKTIFAIKNIWVVALSWTWGHMRLVRAVCFLKVNPKRFFAVSAHGTR